MVNRLWFLMILLFGNSASSFADIIYFPQVADGGGYITTIVLVNTGGTRVDGTFYSAPLN